jgi:hypothetical protein
VTSPGQLDLSGPAGSTQTANVTVTNVGATTRTVSARGRQLGQALSDSPMNVALDPTLPTFNDEFGQPMAYRLEHVNVPAGADRIDATVAWPDANAYVNLTLVDPAGKMTAFTYQNGPGANFAHVDVRAPLPGNWTVVVWTPQSATNSGFTGTAHVDISTARFANVDQVSPGSLTLAPGQSGTFHVAVGLPSSPGDSSQDLEIDGNGGQRQVLPVVLRSLVGLGPQGGTFTGTLTGGDGRDGVYEQLNTYAFDVPPGTPELSVAMVLAHDPGTELEGFLVSPDGQAQSQNESDPLGSSTQNFGLEAHALAPKAGRWQFIVAELAPAGGTVVSAPFVGHVDLRATPVTTRGVPDGANTVLGKGRTATATVRVANIGVTPLNLFADPRLNTTADLQLVGLDQTDNLPLPVPGDGNPPAFLVPTQTSSVTGTAQATEPMTFDLSPASGDPAVVATSTGDDASATITAADQLESGLWFLAPSPLGPFAGPAPAATVSAQLTAHTQAFDPNAGSSTGDQWLTAVDPTAPGATTVAVAPGASGTITLSFTAHGHKGSVVSGTVYIDDNVSDLGTGDELAAIPYRYRIG